MYQVLYEERVEVEPWVQVVAERKPLDLQYLDSEFDRFDLDPSRKSISEGELFVNGFDSAHRWS